MANWTQKKILMTMGGVALGVCGLAAGGVYYTHGLIDEIGGKVAEKAVAVVAADAKIIRIPEIEKDVIILHENLGEYVKILPDSRELNDFVRMLQKFDRQSGIRSTGLKKKKAGDKSKALFSPIQYTYEMTATLWQGLKFMNLIENFERFVSVTAFNIKPGELGSDTIDGEVVHTISLTMQTFTYNKGGAQKGVTIPNYEDRKLELREEIWARMNAIRIDHYEHPGMQGRRDIFVDPRESGLGGGTDPSNADQRDIIEKHIGAIEQMNKTLEKIRAEGTTLFEQYSLEKAFKANLAKALGEVEADAGMIVYRPYRLRWSQEVIAPLDGFKQQVANVVADPPKDNDPFLPGDDIAALIAQMTDDCNNGQLEQASERYEAVRDRLAVPVTDARYSLAVDAKSWHHKATTALDFKGLDLNVQGVVVSGGGSSGVLLNGEVFEEGDYIADDLLVKLVEEEQVWFVFRGLTLVRTM
ncbi:MAG: Tfp pilus assembly protein PilO [Planctomycetota bacterium]|jgi:Tfp pilus assembly protein PilO